MNREAVNKDLLAALEKYAQPLAGNLQDFDPIVAAAEDVHLVLLGEASHGTHEFYQARAAITQRLIMEQGYDAVAVEADWPDAWRVNRFVGLRGEDIDVEEALGGFERFPAWMWRNREVERFVRWLHEYNYGRYRAEMGGKGSVGFYGLDLYSLNRSIHAVIDYLEGIDPDAADRARIRYGCLYHFMEEPQRYGHALAKGLTESCEATIVVQLKELLRSRAEYLRLDGFIAEDEYFAATQNARVVKGAEEYYRALYRGRPNTWNLRDEHMFGTLEDLRAHLGRRLGHEAKIVVWAHNSHVGNAGATEMGRRGETNIGRLAREKYGKAALLVGFSTARGYVIAADDWDAPWQRKRVRDPFAGSYEDVFDQARPRDFLLDLRENNAAVDLLMEPRLQRAIGVIYRPGTERHSHYFESCLPEQFDFMLHYDETSAVEPIATTMHWHKGELDETYPRGL